MSLCTVLIFAVLALTDSGCSGGPPIDGLGSPISETCGAPDDISYARYRTWHESRALRLQRCEVHCGTRKAVCRSKDASGNPRLHLCNGDFSCHPVEHR